MFHKQPLTMTNQTIPPITSINPTSVVEHGNSPTAIILAVAILIAVFLSSMTGLVRVIMILILQQTKASR
ncbi:MAG: hypothetical protein HC773_07375 [Scytonema sp. CRU_2_7]|nr:hypothetical protein [Scytonema sp. CRU_2_7]